MQTKSHFYQEAELEFKYTSDSKIHDLNHYEHILSSQERC